MDLGQGQKVLDRIACFDTGDHFGDPAIGMSGREITYSDLADKVTV